MTSRKLAISPLLHHLLVLKVVSWYIFAKEIILIVEHCMISFVSIHFELRKLTSRASLIHVEPTYDIL